MTQAGARGATAGEMVATLRLPADAGAVHAAIGELLRDLGGERAGGERLRIANALWVRDGLPILAAFLGVLRNRYGAAPEAADFALPEEACRRINAWVSEQTHGRIQDLVTPGAHVTADTLLVLVNAIYFKAPWTCPFEGEDTRPEPFRLAGGGEVSVPMMRMESSDDKFRFLNAGSFKLLELPYRGRLSIVLALPKEANGMPGLESALTPERLEGTIRAMEHWNVRIRLPKFRIESGFSLKRALSSLGMPRAFDERADFTGIAVGPPLVIGEVVHKAFVELNEEGTEAAAATAVVMDVLGMREEEEEPEWRVFHADHPFLFVIRDRITEAVVFMGRVENPS